MMMRRMMMMTMMMMMMMKCLPDFLGGIRLARDSPVRFFLGVMVCSENPRAKPASN